MYASLADQEKMKHLSNGMETCEISDTVTITSGRCRRPEVNRPMDPTLSSKIILYRN